MASTVFSGTLPALVTPCKADSAPDFGALVARGVEMIAAGISAAVRRGSIGKRPLPTDGHRRDGVAFMNGGGVRSRAFCSLGHT